MSGENRVYPCANSFNELAGSDGAESAAVGAKASVPASLDAAYQPFACLKSLECRAARPVGYVLVVMPLSGHHAALIRDLVLSLAETHTVFLLDWRDARDIPASCGLFGFDDEIKTIVCAINSISVPVHVVGICQSGLPVLTAAAVMARDHKLEGVQSLTFIGVPFVPTINPTDLSITLQKTVRSWLEYTDVRTLGPDVVGQGRRVYPGAHQLKRIQSYIARQNAPCSAVSRKLRHDDGLDPAEYPFRMSLMVLKDTPADVFLDNIDRYYHRAATHRVVLIHDGQIFDPAVLSDVSILTVEGEDDDIVGAGQTSALLSCMPRSSGSRRDTFTVPHGGHFDLFHGKMCREIVVPRVVSFFCDVVASASARPAELC